MIERTPVFAPCRQVPRHDDLDLFGERPNIVAIPSSFSQNIKVSLLTNTRHAMGIRWNSLIVSVDLLAVDHVFEWQVVIE